MPSPEQKKQREQLAEALGQAGAGKLPWLHKLVQAAGYRIIDLTTLRAKHIAPLFEISPVSLGLWHSRMGCPKNPNGTWNLHHVLQWKIDQITQAAKKTENPEDLPGLHRMQEAAADLKEFERDRKRGLLIPKAELENQQRAVAMYFKNAVTTLPRIIAPKLYGQEVIEIEKELTEAFDVMLRKMSGQIEDEKPAVKSKPRAKPKSRARPKRKTKRAARR